MAESPFPNLYLAGAPKCGTTSLAAWIASHPQVFAPIKKEPVIFASDLKRGTARAPEEIATQHYAGWSGEKYALDASTHYFYSRSAPAEIRDARPDARVYMLLRNPADAVNSMFHQLQFNGTETLETIEASLDQEEERTRNPQPVRFGFAENLLYKRVFGFSENIENWRKSFPEEQLSVLLLDDVRDDPQAIMRGIFGQLDLDEEWAASIDYSPRNSAKRARSRLIQNLASYPPEWLGVFSRRLLSFEMRQKLRRKLRSANIAPTSNPPLSVETRHRLNAMFAPEVRWLEDYLQRDLSHWTKPLSDRTSE